MRLNKIFGDYDKDNDGQIDVREVVVGMALIRKQKNGFGKDKGVLYKIMDGCMPEQNLEMRMLSPVLRLKRLA